MFSIFSLAAILLIGSVYLLWRYIRSQESKTGYSFLEILPTKESNFGTREVRSLLKKLHQVIRPESYFSKYLKAQKRLSLYIDASNLGIKLVIAVPNLDETNVKDLILAVDPTLEVNVINYNPLLDPETVQTTGYHQTRHYSFPLISEGETDPLVSLAGVISKLSKNETVVLDFECSGFTSMKAKHLRDQLLSGKTPHVYRSRALGLIASLLRLIIRTLVWLLSLVLSLISEATKPPNIKLTKKTVRPVEQSVNVSNPVSVSRLDKLYEPLFKTSLRLSVRSTEASRRNSLIKDISLSLGGYTSSGFQTLKPGRSLKPGGIYSATEIAGFFHLPKMDNLETVYRLSSFKTLPISNELRTLNKHDPGSLNLGLNIYQGQLSDLRLPLEARQKHLYISGATGSGKSALMSSLIMQDIKAGLGVSLIDPHGDLAEELLKNIPENRQSDVIYFNPSDLDYPIGLNLLELKSFKSSPSYKLETDQLTESVISLFRKLFSEDDSGGHRIEYIIRNSVHTALEVKDATIFTIYRILTDIKFRNQVVGSLTNQHLINFWQSELGSAGDYQRVKMSAGVTTKIGRLLFSEPARRVFGQSSSTINFEDLINENKILICNFSKGRLGEDGSRLFGVAALTKLQLAALSRQTQETAHRKAHYLYVDEFQNFATDSFAQMLSESRKYRLFLTVAEQSPSQQDQRLTSVIMANIGNVISFRNSSPSDEDILLPLYKPYLHSGDLLNIPAYHFYLKSQYGDSAAPISGITLKPEYINDREIFDQVIRQSREKYAYNPISFKSSQSGRQLKLL